MFGEYVRARILEDSWKFLKTDEKKEGENKG